MFTACEQHPEMNPREVRNQCAEQLQVQAQSQLEKLGVPPAPGAQLRVGAAQETL